MRGHTKKQHVDAVSMTFTGPVTMIEQALEAMRALGFEAEETQNKNHPMEDSIHWRGSFHFADVHCGTYLSGARFREGLTQVELAERSGIPRRHISEMENGKRPIGKGNARKLADALGVDARLLLSV